MKENAVDPRKLSQKLKRLVVGFWLTHTYLPRLQKTEPAYLKRLIKSSGAKGRTLEVAWKRYVEDLKFEAIAIDLKLDLRLIYKDHSKFIDLLFYL